MKTLLGALLVLVIPTIASAQSQRHFFPRRPPNVETHAETGVLIAYAMGNDAGGFTIAHGSRKIEFAIGYPLTLAGKLYPLCLPTPSRTRDDDGCKKWPNNLVVGKSRVCVTYWWQNEPGVGMVRASDHIALL